jgi:hypothetical protein
MKTTFFVTAAAVAAMFGAPAMAWEGHKIECYDKHWVPATYTTSKKLKHAARTEWEHRDGQLAKVHYPAMYIEHTHLATAGHYVLRKAPCN